MEPHLQSRPTSNEAPTAAAATSGALDRLRALPIRWRILSIATLNIAIAVVFTAIIWNGAQVLTTARSELRESREADRQLAVLESQAGRLQGLIHRYFTQPDGERPAGDHRAAQIAARHVAEPRLRGSDLRGLGRRRGPGHRTIRRRLRRPAQCADRHHGHLREPGAGAGTGNVRALRDRGRRHHRPQRPGVAGALEVARIVLDHAGPDQRLLSSARGRYRHGGDAKPGADREHRPGHAGPRRQRSAARGVARHPGARDRLAAGHRTAGEKLRHPRPAPERCRRRQSGRHGRYDRAPVQQHAGAGTPRL